MFTELENLPVEDKQFMMMKNGAKFVNGHYQLPLPFEKSSLNNIIEQNNNREKLLEKAIYEK